MNDSAANQPSNSDSSGSDSSGNDSMGSDSKSCDVVIGVSGGIACYKSAALVSLLVQRDIQVQVVMTANAHQFIGRATFEALTGRTVFSDSFDLSEFSLGPHIGLASTSKLLCIAPATANLMAKAANGIADDLLTTLLLSFTGPILMAPAMNCDMWEKRSVQRNLELLVGDGVQMIGPDEGWLSCRLRGKGRMSSPESIADAIIDRLEGGSDAQ